MGIFCLFGFLSASSEDILYNNNKPSLYCLQLFQIF